MQTGLHMLRFETVMESWLSKVIRIRGEKGKSWGFHLWEVQCIIFREHASEHAKVDLGKAGDIHEEEIKNFG